MELYCSSNCMYIVLWHSSQGRTLNSLVPGSLPHQFTEWVRLLISLCSCQGYLHPKWSQRLMLLFHMKMQMRKSHWLFHGIISGWPMTTFHMIRPGIFMARFLVVNCSHSSKDFLLLRYWYWHRCSLPPSLPLQLSDQGGRRHKQIRAAVAGRESLAYEESIPRYIQLIKCLH